MTLSHLVAAHINRDKEDKERDPKRLFLSDIGKCPREVAYRLMEAERDHETEQEKINKTIMFDLAERIERNVIDALDAEGMLIAEQLDIEMPDRTNWGGRLDILADYYGRRVIEVKSKYPGAFKYDLTTKYIWEHHQARSYDHYCHDGYGLTAEPLLSYWDRGGQNTPQEVLVAVEWASTCQEMDVLDDTRERLPELPERLGKVLNLKNWYKDLILEPDGRCKRPYCKYTETCKQDMSTSCMASRTKEGGMWLPWKTKKAVSGHESLVEEFLTDFAHKEMENM